MKYIGESIGSVYYPKLLGTYEQELHPIIDRIIELAPEQIVDIGAAEGYYAVGLAIRLRDARITAFEQATEGRNLLSEMCRLNCVANRVSVRGRCDQRSLLEAIPSTGTIAVICDVEGFENELFDSEVLSALRRAYVLVELHEFASAGVASRLSSRFATTHAIRQIWQVARNRADYPFANWFTTLLPRAYATYQVQEFRPETMSWFWMEPRSLPV
jgi:predicted O-methyltransferase YrrM